MTYTLNIPIGFKNFKHSIAINYLITKPMENKKVPFKFTQLKSKVRITHYIVTRIPFPRIINYEYVVREDIVPL